jgi:hypothetical protein
MTWLAPFRGFNHIRKSQRGHTPAIGAGWVYEIKNLESPVFASSRCIAARHPYGLRFLLGPRTTLTLDPRKRKQSRFPCLVLVDWNCLFMSLNGAGSCAASPSDRAMANATKPSTGLRGKKQNGFIGRLEFSFSSPTRSPRPFRLLVRPAILDALSATQRDRLVRSTRSSSLVCFFDSKTWEPYGQVPNRDGPQPPIFNWMPQTDVQSVRMPCYPGPIIQVASLPSSMETGSATECSGDVRVWIRFRMFPTIGHAKAVH